MLAISPARLLALAAVSLIFCSGLIGIARAAPPTTAPALPEGAGLAAKYPGDADLSKNPAVFFTDNFESGDLKNWDDKSGTITVTTEKPHAGHHCAAAPMH